MWGMKKTLSVDRMQPEPAGFQPQWLFNGN